MSNKLELTWYGKDKEINIEPRILIENKELSNTEKDPDTQNMLIHGDNLLALKALEKEYSGKIKCIYIDPPYNTGNAFQHYDDNLEHSIWLKLMYSRLKLLKNLLSDDGVIIIEIDDDEMAYLKILLDEIFGRNNFLNCITVETGEVFGQKAAHINKKFVKVKDYLLIYKKSDSFKGVKPIYTATDSKFDIHYSNYIDSSLKKIKLIDYLSSDKKIVTLFHNYKIKLNLRNIEKMMLLEDSFADYIYSISDKIFQDQPYTSKVSGKDFEDLKKGQILDINGRFVFMTKSGSLRYYQPFSDAIKKTSDYEHKFTRATARGDLWKSYHIDMRNVKKEGGVTFKSSKKPERLVYDILLAFTNENDIVLDSFLGSGTTVAVAQKTGRRWIGIEMGEHAFTHAKPRIDSILEGVDNTGVSRFLNNKKYHNGGYKFYELAPTLINEDKFGQPIINKDYSPDMLASAVALHEGFKYQPSEEIFWKQSKNNENSYLFVTTRHIDADYINSIKDSMEENEYLIISCKSYDKNIEYKYPNIKIKKIPQMLLDRCEFGVDNYNLNIINPPIIEDEEEGDEE